MIGCPGELPHLPPHAQVNGVYMSSFLKDMTYLVEIERIGQARATAPRMGAKGQLAKREK